MSTLRLFLTRLSLSLVFIFTLNSCQAWSFKAGEKDAGIIADSKNPQGIDRPSEDSEGIPGYRLMCSVTQTPDAFTPEGHLSCALVDAESSRKTEELSAIADDWRWDLTTSSPLNGSYTIQELSNEPWHVRYIFSGAPYYLIAEDIINSLVFFEVQLKNSSKKNQVAVPVRQLLDMEESSDDIYREMLSLLATYDASLDEPLPEMLGIIDSARQSLEQGLHSLRLLRFSTMRWCRALDDMFLQSSTFFIESLNVAQENLDLINLIEDHLYILETSGHCFENSHSLSILSVDELGTDGMTVILEPILEHEVMLDGKPMQSIQLSVKVTNNNPYYMLCQSYFETTVIIPDGKLVIGPNSNSLGYQYPMLVAPVDDFIYRHRRFTAIFEAFELLDAGSRFAPEASFGSLKCVSCENLDVTSCSELYQNSFPTF